MSTTVPKRRASRRLSGAVDTESFVSGEKFKFHQLKSPQGVMTRSRRSSIYGPSSLPEPSDTSAAKNRKLRVSKLPVLHEAKPAPRGRISRRSVAPTAASYTDDTKVKGNKRESKATSVEPKTIPKGSSKANKINITTGRKRGAEDEGKVALKTEISQRHNEKRNKGDPDETQFQGAAVVLEKLENTPAKHFLKNGVFQNLDAKHPDLTCEIISDVKENSRETKNLKVLEIPERNLHEDITKPTKPELSPANRLTKSVKKQGASCGLSGKERLCPQVHLYLSKQKNALVSPVPGVSVPAYLGTPQSANPMEMLRKNQKHKVKEQMEEKIAELPPLSPYALVEGETETGSPDYAFTRLGQGPLKSAARYLTGTPARKLGSVRESASHTNGFTPTGSPPEVTSPAYSSESSPAQATTDVMMDDSMPKAEPQLLTGDLASVCTIA